MPEVKGPPSNGGWYSAFCHYCGWASQARDRDAACDLNETHERTHPEWTKPPTLKEWRDEMHADHVCTPGRCGCKCGCQIELGCTVLFGEMCVTCLIREMRGEEDEHGLPPSPSVADRQVVRE